MPVFILPSASLPRLGHVSVKILVVDVVVAAFGDLSPLLIVEPYILCLLFALWEPNMAMHNLSR